MNKVERVDQIMRKFFRKEAAEAHKINARISLIVKRIRLTREFFDSIRNHVIFFSGGLGSWATAKRVVEKHGIKDLYLVFQDTLIEDEDLYRFMIEAIKDIYQYGDVSGLLRLVQDLPEIKIGMTEEDWRIRKLILDEIAYTIHNLYPNVHWLMDGRDVWEVFKDVRYLGNSRVAPCTHKLKQEISKAWLLDNFSSEDTVLYLGIDWTEKHRMEAPKKNWKPYEVKYPMGEEPYVMKDELMIECEKVGIRVPRLYKLGFSHNNCGGFCVKAGQAHFINLLKNMPERYAYHEHKEQQMRKFLDKDVSILSRSKVVKKWVDPIAESIDDIDPEQLEKMKPEDLFNALFGGEVKVNEKYSLTLKQLREEHEAKSAEIDYEDFGGCGCFVEEDYEQQVYEICKS